MTNQQITQQLSSRESEVSTVVAEHLDLAEIRDTGVVYYDAGMHRYYLAPLCDLLSLVSYATSDDPDVQREAFSHWCSESCHAEVPGYALPYIDGDAWTHRWS